MEALVEHLKDQLIDLKGERDAALERERDALTREREALITIGLLREAVGALWSVVDAAKEEANNESWLPEDSLVRCLENCDKRMKAVNDRFCLPGDDLS